MLKNSKPNNLLNINKIFQYPVSESRLLISKTNHEKYNQKKETKIIKSNSIIKYKESEVKNDKQIILSKRNSMKNKYNKINTTNINENKEKRKNNIIKNHKYKKNNSIAKENKNILNYISSSRKNSLPKQMSFASKISNDDIHTTIDNDNGHYSKNIKKKNIKTSNCLNNINNKKINNINDSEINQLKQILIKKQNIKNNIEKILSNKQKNFSSNKNKSKNFSNNISKTNNNIMKENINSFSPIQKNNNNLYNICSQPRKNIFSNNYQNNNCNLEIYNINSNQQKSLDKNKNKDISQNKNRNNKNTSSNKYLNNKIAEKSCPILNIDYINIKNIQDSNVEENINKNSSSNNIILRNTSGPNLNNSKGVLKPFCSLINIPINNKEKKENNAKTNSNYSISNENINYFFDKDKYFNDFKNRINLNINNLFFKLKRKNYKNIYNNISKNNDYKESYPKKINYLSEENNENKNDININTKANKINNILTEKINKKEIKIKNEKILRIKKIKSINLINNSNKKKSENEKDDFILNDLLIKKRNARKRSTDNLERNIINSTNSSNLIYSKTNNKNSNKNSFTSFYRRSINDNHKKNYNSYFINMNNTNCKGRNDYNILNNNVFDPQTTVYQKHYFYKNRINNTNSSSNRNIYSQKSEKNGKSFKVYRNKKEKIENKSVINSGRNKKVDNVNNNKNENNYLKIIKLFDELRKNKSFKKYKKKELEICLLNNSSNNINNNYFENINIKEKKRKMKMEVDENKVKENISQNTLTMYTVYILSKYDNKCKKVGLMKIIILDKNGNCVPVICYNSNSNLINSQHLTNNNLFKLLNRNNYISSKNKDLPFIMEFKKNLYINFYIKNIKSNNIDYIQIINYSDIKNGISSVKNIRIFKGNRLIYKGILKDNNTINKIPLYSNFNNNKCSSMINQNNKNINIDNIKQRPLSSSKTRSCNNILITKASTYRKNEVNEYYAKRNVFNKSYRKNYFFSDNNYNYNEANYINKRSKAFIYSNKKHSASDIRNTKLLTGFLGQEVNISNTYTINNITNNPQKTYYGNGDKFLNYNDISGNRNFEQKFFYNSIKNNNKKLNYNISNISNQNNEKPKIINEYDNNIQRNGDKIFMKSNSEKKFKKSIIKTQKSLLFQKLNEENNNDFEVNNINKTNYDSNYNYSINNNKYDINKKYIEFNKIRFILTSNYGHNKYIGLTGIIFYNLKDHPINIEKASSIGALPKDLKTILDDNNENRIFENIFNNNNNTNESDNMWVTKFKKKPPLTFIELYFQDRIRVSRIKIYNYNEKNRLDIGVKTIDIYLDDEFYNTIFIRKGIGEIANDFITLNNDNNSSIEDLEKYKIYDFGQNFTFPLIDDENNNYYNCNIVNNEFNKINNTTYINYSNNKVKYASFLYEQSYETPYLPCGYYIQFQFCSNYNKGIVQNSESDTLKYNDIGLDNIEIYDNEGKNLLLKNSDSKNKYKLLSNCEINHNELNKIILNVDIRNCNNSIFYIFEKNIQISSIKFYPLTKNENGKNIQSIFSLKEVKILSENNIIFEGDLYLDQPTIVLFTCDSKILKSVKEKYLTKNMKNRDFKEIFKEEYISLILN